MRDIDRNIANELKKVQEEFIMSYKIISNQELEEFHNRIINDYDNMINEISKVISKDKDILLLKEVIEAQHEIIKKLTEKKVKNIVGGLNETTKMEL